MPSGGTALSLLRGGGARLWWDLVLPELPASRTSAGLSPWLGCLLPPRSVLSLTNTSSSQDLMHKIIFFKGFFFFSYLVLAFENAHAVCTAFRRALGFPPTVIALKLQIVGKSNFLYIREASSSSHPSHKPLQSLSPSPAFSPLQLSDARSLAVPLVLCAPG